MMRARTLSNFLRPCIINGLKNSRNTSGENPYAKVNKLYSTLFISSATAVSYICGAILFGDEHFYRRILLPTVHSLVDEETAHVLLLKIASLNIIPIRLKMKDYPLLRTEAFGRVFSNPIGLAAGCDKNAVAIRGLGRMGFGFVEIGSITPLPQEGNEKPRVFRLTEDEAVINRYGFPSEGHEVVLNRIVDYRNDYPKSSGISRSVRYQQDHNPVEDAKNSLNSNFSSNVGDESPLSRFAKSGPLLGVNLGMNKTSGAKDYVQGAGVFSDVADYLVVNISSPNTPGLRDMQAKSVLEKLLQDVLEKMNDMKSTTPLLLKISPDLNEDDLKDVIQVLMQSQGGVSGVIISNTTVTRSPTLRSNLSTESGGLSGKPLQEMSTNMISMVYRETGGKIPIIGCGGVFTGADAYAKIRAGASLVQLYTSMVYHGPPVVEQIKHELNDLLLADGFLCVEDAVGVDCISSANIEEVKELMEKMIEERVDNDLKKMAKK